MNLSNNSLTSVCSVLPATKSHPFSFTLNKTISPVLGYAKQGDVIIEDDGVFSISNHVETNFEQVDISFKQLVDSILLEPDNR